MPALARRQTLLPALLLAGLACPPAVLADGAVTIAERAELRAWAEAELAGERGGGAALPRIRAEPDAARRAALWSRWLAGLPVDAVLDDVERRALESLAADAPRVSTVHHEFPRALTPAFALAARARARLRRDRVHAAARVLAEDPPALTGALTGRDAGLPFESGLVALAAAPGAVRDALVDRYRAAPRAWPNGGRVMLRIVALDTGHADVLVDVIRHGGADTARAALRRGLDQHKSLPAGLLQRLAEAGLRRAAPSGLALQVWRAAGGDPGRAWRLLGRPGIGADAARLLAADEAGLVERIRAEIDSAPPPARLHMLLALKFRASPEARALLSELARAGWLSPQQRVEIAQWL